ncbi:acyl-CoA dehydrogenase [Microbacterium testaceum]|uniref:Acyl-[acyl-carrier-protein] dehydrogenase MbtN n=1 Tax=Microbacterium testaceum TaxID=2033 RepID=A0A147ET53_MICTE|nr:acyl-CoA dehydrogenase family protein [Microbacterium testaceum]KTR87866.1 acyl-CoA dehydrogenase [Microbacterium testaceum]
MSAASPSDGFYSEDHEAFREVVREFLARTVVPHYAQWEEDHLVPREAWIAAGEAGLTGLAVPEEYGGADEPDYRYRMVFAEESARAATTSFGAGFGVQDDIVIPYLLDLATDEQKQRWLPGAVTGETITAIAMSEPGAGSDVQGIRTSAVRDGDAPDADWILTGQKTFITNGIHADLVIVAVRTDPDAGSHGYSLFVVERGMPGFERGRKLDKVGLHGQDTAELFFDDVRVPAANVLGEPGKGFGYLMERLPRERMSIAVSALVAAEAAYGWARDYVFERHAFGGAIGDLQTVRFTLAELETELDVTRAFIERCVLRLNDDTLTTVEASKAKWWASELQLRVTTRALQLFGGYGFMEEYPIAKAFRDSRIQTIYGGTTEIMKEIIGRDIAKRARR